MQNQLQKAINLAKITGDKIIVIDSLNPEKIFVIMSLEEYEEFISGKNEIRSLTEEELLDKINRDVAVWKSENDEKAEKNKDFFDGREEITPSFLADRKEPRPNVDEEDEEDMYYYEEPFAEMELEDGLEEDDYYIPGKGKDKDKNKFGNHWKIPSSIKSSAEEVVKDIPF